jgi:hypothetical protein
LCFDELPDHLFVANLGITPHPACPDRHKLVGLDLLDGRDVDRRRRSAMRHDHELVHTPAKLTEIGRKGGSQLVVDRDPPVRQAGGALDGAGFGRELGGADGHSKVDQEEVQVEDPREVVVEESVAERAPDSAAGARALELTLERDAARHRF